MVKRLVKTTTFFLIFIVLTILSQIGGLAFLMSRFMFRNTSFKYKKAFRLAIFTISYIFLWFLCIPLSYFFNKTPLPIFSNDNLKPANFTTWILNRHYVSIELKNTIEVVAFEMKKKYPNHQTLYLDANFPLFNKFPLLPHLSHNDGKKLDLTFPYNMPNSETPFLGSPSWLGYGHCEKPHEHEVNSVEICENQGYWQYSLMKKLTGSPYYILDTKRSKSLIELLNQQQEVEKIFIEPYLKKRLNLDKLHKIRNHGCHAVRYDDHIHFQIN